MSEAITTFPCRVGLKLLGITPALWLESPRTGRRILIVESYWRELPGRIASRVVKAASTGAHRVSFSRDELAAVKALADRIAERCRPKGGNAPAPSRSFSGHRYLR